VTLQSEGRPHSRNDVSTLSPACVGKLKLQVICPGGSLELTGAPSPKIAAVSG
jgi:hypothetical protein